MVNVWSLSDPLGGLSRPVTVVVEVAWFFQDVIVLIDR
jgi:hypothetical protein